MQSHRASFEDDSDDVRERFDAQLEELGAESVSEERAETADN